MKRHGRTESMIVGKNRERGSQSVLALLKHATGLLLPSKPDLQRSGQDNRSRYLRSPSGGLVHRAAVGRLPIDDVDRVVGEFKDKKLV